MTRNRQGAEDGFSAIRAARRPVALVFVLSAVVLATGWSSLLFLARQERELIVSGQLAQNLNLVRAFEEQVRRTLAAAALALNDLEEGHARDGGRFDAASFFRARREAGEPYSFFGIVDEQGETRFAYPAAGGDGRVCDGAALRQHAAGSSRMVVVGEARKDRAAGRWEVCVSRRLEKSGGGFGGYVAVGVPADHLSSFHERIRLGPGALVALVGRDGMVRARRTDEGHSAGQGLAGQEGFHDRFLVEREGTLTVASAVDGVRRLMAFRSVGDFPLVSFIGSAEASVLAPFERRLDMYLGLAVLASLMGLAFAALLTRQFVRNAAANEALRVGEARLSASEAGLREAQSIARLGSWELDLATGELTWSDGIFGIFEIDQHRFGASYEAFLELVHPGDRDLVDRTYRESLANRTEYSVAHRLLMPDGRVKHVLERGRSQFGADGKPLRSTGTVQDVTMLREAEEALKSLNEQLERKVAERTRELESTNRELETFTYSVSHDLKGPLRGVFGYARLLEQHQAGSDAEARQYLERIRQSAAQMDRLIDDLLAYTRLERSETRVSEFSIAELVDSILAECDQEMRARGVRVVRNFAPGTTLHCDRDGLTMALRNLVGNAIKFCRPEVAPEVEIAAERAGGKWVLRVRDNGIGFDMKYHDRIFAIFQRLHRAEDYAGTGVGLAIVKKAVERMGGRVWAESRPGAGTTFHLEIPAQGGAK